MTRSGEFGRLVAAAVLGALMVSVVPAVAAGVGDPLVLGELNGVDARTTLKGDAKGAMLQVQSTGNAAAILAKADRNAVKVKVGAGQSPITVNGSAGTATNLSADELDGMDSTAFLGVGATAADAELLDGLDSTEFLGAGAKAVDSGLLDGMDSTEFLGVGATAVDAELLDGNDSSAFLMASDVVAAHNGGFQSEVVTGTDEVVRSVTLTAPSAGVVVVNSTAGAREDTAGDDVRCSITTGTTLDLDFGQFWESAGVDGGEAQLAGTRGFDVSAGPFTANLVCDHAGSSGSSFIRNSAMTAIFIPTG